MGAYAGMGYKHLIDLNDFTMEEWKAIIDLALQMHQKPKDFLGLMHGKILGTLFYEPSTRTQMSFQTAMLRLGGQVIGFDNPQNSSVAKGENLKDTITIISNYADIIAIRHPVEGSAKAAAMHANCPIINAGDGGHLHPTQTLTDLVTLSIEKGRTDHLTIGLCGDLKYGRTVHSLISAMRRFPGNRFVLISTPELTVPQFVKDLIQESECTYTEISSLAEAIPHLDVLYMTRVQRERFASLKEYERLKSVYILDEAKMRLARPDLCVLHPLPRVDEIEIAVDNDPRALYFKQASYGVYARMALILKILTEGGETPLLSGCALDVPCSNSNCITRREPYIRPYYRENGNILTCEFCEHQQKRS